MNARTIRRAPLLALCMALLAAPTDALYRGDEFEVRDFNVGNTFFINRAMIRQFPETWDRYRAATNAFIGSAGSLSSTDLYLHQEVKVSHPLGAAYTLHADYLRDRDFDGTFDRFTMGLEYRFSREWSIELLGEPLPDKENADIGGALKRYGDISVMRLQWLFVDFVFDSKNPDDARMERSAPNIQFEAQFQPTPDWDVRLHTDFDPARRLVNPTESFQFRFEKYQAEIDVRRQLSERDQVRVMAEGEYSRQLREGLAGGDANDFSTDREYVMLVLEFLRRMEFDTHLRAGAAYIRFDEDIVFPNESEATFLNDRHDGLLYVGRSWPLREGIHLNSRAMVNLADMRRTRKERSMSSTRLQGRVAGGLLFVGDTYHIEAGMAANVDRTRFGGGFMRVFADF